jgi:hypothetical protein
MFPSHEVKSRALSSLLLQNAKPFRNHVFETKFINRSVLRIRDVSGSRILIFYPSRIPDPKTETKERGEKKFVVILFM